MDRGDNDGDEATAPAEESRLHGTDPAEGRDESGSVYSKPHSKPKDGDGDRYSPEDKGGREGKNDDGDKDDAAYGDRFSYRHEQQHKYEHRDGHYDGCDPRLSPSNPYRVALAVTEWQRRERVARIERQRQRRLRINSRQIFP
jgi:hypothetical protein